MHFLDLGYVKALALYRQVNRLTARHAEGAAGLGKQPDQPQPHGRIGRQCRVAGEQLKRQRL